MATVLVCAGLYFIPQRWSINASAALPLTVLDRAIPFWPATGLVYFASFVFLVGTFLSLSDKSDATRFLYACLLAQIIATLCFVCWPVRYPRELLELPADSSAIGAALVHYVRAVDAPVNCFPSLHVSTATMCALVLRRGHWKSAALPVAAVLAASTLTFKQHYLIDVVGGAVLGGTVWWLCFEWRGLRLR